jgi:hypothetical protein
VFESRQKTIPRSGLVILPVDGYHAAANDPDMTARIVREFIDRHSTSADASANKPAALT